MNASKRVAHLLSEGPVVLFSAEIQTWTTTFVSPNISNLLGYSADEYVAEPDFWMKIIHPEDIERVKIELNRLLNPEEPDQIIIESRLRHKNGRYVCVRSSMQLLLDEATNIQEVSGFLSDHTDEMEHKLAMERQQQKLKDINESMEQYVYIASHDLREPLIGVAGYATLVLRRYSDKLDAQGKHFLTEVVSGCKAMERKIDDLLELSRAGRGSPNGPFPLGSAVEGARKSLVGPIEKSGATILYEGLPMVRGDRGQITQVFQNLFSNSIKYATKDVAPVITVSAETHPEDPNWWVIEVKDNGIGFDMRHAERIFGVFQRLYTVDQYPGTGIGLAIVKKIIDKHGGKIWALSHPGMGATFYFTLAKTDT